jgi:hypothetical protein
MSQNYRISFSIGDVRFDIESTDKKWIVQKEKEYLEKISKQGKKSVIRKETKEETTPAVLPKNLTINEFYRAYVKDQIKSRPNIAVFLIYYLEKILNKTPISTNDVKQCFADISYPSYNKINFTDILQQAKKKALLNNVSGAWTLTITGEDFVLNSISSSGK